MESLQKTAKRELAARAIDDAILVDCVRACTEAMDGEKLPRRVLRLALKRLYKINPGFRQLDAAVSTAHREIRSGYISKSDRRRAFLGLAVKASPEMPDSVYLLWNRRLKQEGLNVGAMNQIIDLFKVARGEGASDIALEYLHNNDWSRWEPKDRVIFEGWYVDGKTTPGMARALGLKNWYVWNRLAIHQHRAGVPSSGEIDGDNAVEVTAAPGYPQGRKSSRLGHVGGFAVRGWGEDE